MSLHAFQENWDALRGRLKETYGKLTDDDITCIEGRRERLVSILQERYKLSQEEAEFQSEIWARRARIALIDQH